MPQIVLGIMGKIKAIKKKEEQVKFFRVDICMHEEVVNHIRQFTVKFKIFWTKCKEKEIHKKGLWCELQYLSFMNKVGLGLCIKKMLSWNGIKERNFDLSWLD